MNAIYEEAKKKYAEYGIDTEEVIKKLGGAEISVHCWQGDDVIGFDSKKALSGGIQTTGNYPGKARTPEELMQDLDKALSFCAGKHKLNLHASYAIFEDGEFADRDAIEPKHFRKWVELRKGSRNGHRLQPDALLPPQGKDSLTLSCR